MPKGRRRGFETTGTGRRDKLSRAEGNLEILKGEISRYLDELQQWEAHHARRRGVAPFDYSKAREALRRLPERLPNISVIFDTLFQEGVPLGVQNAMIEELKLTSSTGGPLRIEESHIKDRFFGRGLIQDVKLPCRRGGEEWLGNFLGERRANKRLELDDAYRVQALGRTVSAYGEESSVITRLMFMLGSDEPDGGGKTGYRYDPVEKLKTVIASRQKESPGRQITVENNFFERIRNFIAVYADITHMVMQGTRAPEKRADIDRNAKNILSRFLQLEDFQHPYWDQSKGPPDPFTVFQGMLLDSVKNNPWITEDCSETPFDVEKFGRLI